MKLIKSVAIGTLALVALTGCDRRSDQVTDRGTGASQNIERTEFVADPAVNPETVGTSYHDHSHEDDRSSAIGTGAGAAAGVGATAVTGAGTRTKTKPRADNSTSTGSGEASDEWVEEDYSEDDFRAEDSTYEGTGGGAVTPDTSDSTIQEEEDTGTLYLDNTSSEADLTERDRGIPIGREPNFYNKSSSEGNPKQL